MRKSKEKLTGLDTPTVDRLKSVRDKGHATLINYGGGSPSTVDMTWNINQSTIEDQIFRLDISPKDSRTVTLYLDKQALMKYLRWV